MALRLIFMGTPQFAVPTLAAIIAAGHEVVAVYTQPPRPAGRGMAEQKSPVQQMAEKSGIPVLTPKSLKGKAGQAAFKAHDADVAVVIAYGMLLPNAILDAPRLGCYNAHASLLPRWRGAAPIQRAIMAGDHETAATVMKVEAALDTGPIALLEKIAINPDMTAGKLHDQLSSASAALMVRALAGLEGGLLTLTPQSPRGVTYASKIDKAESRIDWARPASEVHNHIRGLSPFPGAWCEMEIGGRRQRVKILRSQVASGSGAPGALLDDALTIACKPGALRLVRLQRAGRKPQDGEKFVRGNRISKVH